MFQNYAVAIRLSLENQVTMGLIGLSRQFTHLHGQATALQTQMTRIGMLAVGGGVFVGLGMAMTRMFDAPIHKAMQLQGEISKLATLPLPDDMQQRIIQASKDATHEAPTSTVQSNLEKMREMIPTFGPIGPHRDKLIEEAIAALPYVNMAEGILTAFGKQQDHVGRKMVQLIDQSITGPVTTEFVRHHAEMITRSIAQNQGLVSVDQMVLAAMQAGSAYNRYDDTMKYAVMSTLISESGGKGSQVGTWLNYVQRAGSGRRLVNRSNKDLWIESGLLSARAINDAGLTTGGAFVKPGDLKDYAMFMRNPFEWVEKYTPLIRELAAKKGLQPLDIIDSLFGNSVMAGRMMAMLYNRQLTIRRDINMWEANKGTENYMKLVHENPALMDMAFKAQVAKMQTTVGEIILPFAMWSMNILIPALEKLSAWMEKNPGTVKTLTYAFLGLGTALTFVGTVMLLTAAFRALGIFLGLVRIPGAALAAGPVLKTIMNVGAAMGRAIPAALRLLVNPLALGARLFGLLGAAIAVLLNPVTWIVVAVTAAAGAFMYFYNHSAKFRAFVMIAGDYLANTMTAISRWFSNLLNWIGKLVGIKNLGGAWDAVFKADPQVAASAEEMRKRYWEQHGGRVDAQGRVRPANDNRQTRATAAPPAGGHGRPIQVHSRVQMDGRAVATAVTRHQTGGLGAAQGAGHAYDPAVTPPAPGASAAGQTH